jgi:hypothetical protein
MRFRSVLSASLIAIAAYTLVGRPLQLRGGLRIGSARTISRDDMIAAADLTATRVITITPRRMKWAWIAQPGQGLGGFYSYNFLENLSGGSLIRLNLASYG